MRQITVTEEKRMTVPQRREAMPYELLADGLVVGVVKDPADPDVTGDVKCPNCKFTFALPKKDNSPAFFSVRRL